MSALSVVVVLAALAGSDGPEARRALAQRLEAAQDHRVSGLGACALEGTTALVCGKGEIKKCQACALRLSCPVGKVDASRGPFAPPPPTQQFALQLEVGPDRVEQPTEKLPKAAREYSATLRLLPSNVTLDLADTVITYFRPASFYGSSIPNFVPAAAIGPSVLNTLCKTALRPPAGATP